MMRHIHDASEISKEELKRLKESVLPRLNPFRPVQLNLTKLYESMPLTLQGKVSLDELKQTVDKYNQ